MPSDSRHDDLISRKKEINQRTSKIIDLLIQTKDSWNGKPAPGIGVTDSHSLSQSIPDETLETMENITEMVSDVNSKLKQIDRQQSGFSRDKDSREKSKKPSDGSLDLSAIASNPVDRFISHVKAPFQFGDEEKWARLKLLRASAKIQNHIDKLQSIVLSNSNDSIPNAVYKTKNLFHIFDNELVEPMLASLRNLPEKTPESPQVQEVQQDDGKYESETDQFQGNSSDLYQPADIIAMTKAMKSQVKAARDKVIPETFKPFIGEFNNINRRMSYVLSLVNTNYYEAEKEFRNLLADVQYFMDNVNELSQSFQKEANRFTNWLKRKKLQLTESKYEHSKVLRLRFDEKSNQIRNDLNKFMDALQTSHITPGSLSNDLKKITNSFLEMSRVVFRLADIHNSKAKAKNYKLKGQNKWPTIPSTDLKSIDKLSRNLESIINKIDSLQEIHG